MTSLRARLGLGLVISLVFGIGFGFIPVYLSFMA